MPTTAPSLTDPDRWAGLGETRRMAAARSAPGQASMNQAQQAWHDASGWALPICPRWLTPKPPYFDAAPEAAVEADMRGPDETRLKAWGESPCSRTGAAASQLGSKASDPAAVRSLRHASGLEAATARRRKVARWPAVRIRTPPIGSGAIRPFCGERAFQRISWPLRHRNI